MADTQTMPELPKTFKAAVYDKPGEVSTTITELDMPEPGPGEILVKLYVFLGSREA
jgi:propanol-preferring alcohol dehydrogenase